MAKKQSCSRCKRKFEPGEVPNKLKGFILCDRCYPGIPPHIGEVNYRQEMERHSIIQNMERMGIDPKDIPWLNKK